MPEGGPISLGDITLHFAADLSDLNAATVRLEAEMPERLAKSSEAADKLGASFAEVGKELDATADNAAYAGEVIVDSAHKAQSEYSKAYGTVSLFGELTGITLPRHVRTLIATLPGIGSALSAAFSAFAIIFVVEAILKAIKAVEDYQKKTRELAEGWTAVENKGRDALERINDEVLRTQIKLDEFRGDHVEALRKELILIDHQTFDNLRKDIEELGKTAGEQLAKLDRWTDWVKSIYSISDPKAGAKAKEEIAAIGREYDALTRAGAKTQAFDLIIGKIMDVTRRMDSMRAIAAEGLYQGDVSKDLAALQGILDYLNRVNEAQNTRLEGQKKQNQAAIDDNSSKMLAEQEKALTRVNALAQRNLNERLADIKAIETAEKVHFERRELSEKQWREVQDTTGRMALEAQLDYSRQLLANAEKLGTAEEKKAAAQNLEITRSNNAAKAHDLDAASQARLNKLAEEFEKIVQRINAGWTLAGRRASPVLEWADEFGKAEEAAKMFGFELSGTMAANVEVARKALVDLQRAYVDGKVSLDDYLRGQLVMAQVELLNAHRMHLSNREIQERIRILRQALGEETRYGHAVREVVNAMAHAILQSAEAFGEGAITIGTAMRAIAAAVIQGIADIAAKKGAENLGWAFEALGKHDYAAAANHFIASAEWFALAAVVGMAAGATRGGGGGGEGSRGGGSQSTPFAPPQQPEQNPVTVINMPHLARGGIVTQPVLAAMGESAGGGRGEEGVIPLDDDRSLAKIADRIASFGGGGTIINVQVDGMISADNLHAVVRRISRDVGAGKVHLTASNSHLVTKRKQ